MPLDYGLLAGALSALGSIVCFGSFAVPIKAPAVVAAKVDPLYFQCFKSLTCFATSLLVLFFSKFKFTLWGILGALIWVFNGIVAIMAVQLAGMGITQALWSGLSIFVSFLWGAYYFKERLQDPLLAVLGLIVMAAGMMGVAAAASAKSRHPPPDEYRRPGSRRLKHAATTVVSAATRSRSSSPMSPVSRASSNSPRGAARFTFSRTFPGPVLDPPGDTYGYHHISSGVPRGPARVASKGHSGVSSSMFYPHDPPSPPKVQPLDGAQSSAVPLLLGSRSSLSSEQGMASPQPVSEEDARELARRNRRLWQGLLCAVYVGVANGGFMAPFKQAAKIVSPLEYLVSFGIGALLITALLLGLYLALLKTIGKPLPEPHLAVTWRPAILTGLLWSMGNFCSIFATKYLGMAIGWPLVQCSMLVSAMWSILYYKEMEWESIPLFFGSSVTVLLGVFILAHFGGN